MDRRWWPRAKRVRPAPTPGSWPETAERIVSRASRVSAKDASRRSRESCAPEATVRRARPTRRWTGKKEPRRDDPARQPGYLRGKNRTGRERTVRMVAGGPGVVVAAALAGDFRLGARSPAAGAGQGRLRAAAGSQRRHRRP